MTGVEVPFEPPALEVADGAHHAEAAAGNLAATQAAITALAEALDAVPAPVAEDADPTADDEGDPDRIRKILLRAAAGAGKSYALVRMVAEALEHPRCERVAVTAFANKQVFPLAGQLGKRLGRDEVCLFVAAKRLADVPPEVSAEVTVATSSRDIPSDVRVVIGVSHKLGAMGEHTRLLEHFEAGANGVAPFDVLFVDEAWQLPLHRFATVERLAPVAVGVGDVGQLPPLDPGQNPWRGDPGYNPYRAWPTAYEGRPGTWSVDLPAVWRPRAEQLGLWRSFYSDWDRLDCVAAPEDRSVSLPALEGAAAQVWAAVASGAPTLLEVDGLPEAEAPDVDLPLLGVVEQLLVPLLEGGFAVREAVYGADGAPVDSREVSSEAPEGDPLIVLLATRNQAVDDAAELVERLTEKFALPDGVLVASTVDSWQGQTNRITIALHPLSGASRLDEFNSAFGRLAVTCTRATHGLLVLARSGLDDLLATAPARPGTPLGEPGTRTLPRQTHHRILAAFTRGTLHLDAEHSESTSRESEEDPGGRER